jgi:hypothetical protein
LLCLVIAGCGGSSVDLSTVTGTVTLDGVALEGATVEFQPTGEGGSPSYGDTDASGAYNLMFTFSKEGATPGEHTVRISKTVAAPGGEGDDDDDDDDGEETLPAKYNTETTLTATVADGKNEVDFSLTSE